LTAKEVLDELELVAAIHGKASEGIMERTTRPRKKGRQFPRAGQVLD